MIFFDTSFLLAVLIKSDFYHNRALELMNTFNENKMINVVVLNETLNAFAGIGGKVGFSLYDDLIKMFQIDELTLKDFNDSIQIFLNYNSSINFSDCTILHSMQKNNITKIATFDSDFKKVKGLNIIN